MGEGRLHAHCGDGDTAIPAAQRGANVLGIDIARNLVVAGTKRAAEAGLRNCRFQQGDVSKLSGVADRSFHLVLTMFGAMFAPHPFDVAREMVRVTRPGGRIVMGNWIPNDPTLVAQILRISSAYSPTHFLEEFRGFFGPTINAFAAAEQGGRSAELQRELEELFERENRSGTPDATTIAATFLRVTVAV